MWSVSRNLYLELEWSWFMILKFNINLLITVELATMSASNNQFQQPTLSSIHNQWHHVIIVVGIGRESASQDSDSESVFQFPISVAAASSRTPSRRSRIPLHAFQSFNACVIQYMWNLDIYCTSSCIWYPSPSWGPRLPGRFGLGRFGVTGMPVAHGLTVRRSPIKTLNVSHHHYQWCDAVTVTRIPFQTVNSLINFNNQFEIAADVFTVTTSFTNTYHCQTRESRSRSTEPESQ